MWYNRAMITVSQVVNDLVKESPFMEEGLLQGIINLSSLARLLKPKIEARLFKDVQVGAIVMALKRLSQKTSAFQLGVVKLENVLKKLGDITVRSGIVEFTYSNSPTLTQNQAEVMQKASEIKNSFLTITDGIFEASLFASANLATNIEQIFSSENLKVKMTGLSSITIIIPEEATQIPGVYYSILKKLAWEGINIIEVVSSYTELSIFLEEKDVDRAFSALKN